LRFSFCLYQADHDYHEEGGESLAMVQELSRSTAICLTDLA
jgi:hypothetical protein